MEHLVQVVVGDWSNDGHGRTETFFIRSSLNGYELDAAHRAGSSIVGFSLKDDICSGYDNCLITRTQLLKLQELGMTYETENRTDNEDDVVMTDYRDREIEPSFYIGREDYFNFYLFIATLGNPEFKFELIKPGKVNIGGYGLFS